MSTKAFATGWQISRRLDDSRRLFWKRTVAAQIHFLGVVAAIAGLTYLLYLTWNGESRLEFWAAATFGATAILVFSVSTIYHFLHDGFRISPRLEALFEDLDHFSIYLFIAGTYTPVLLHTLSAGAQTFMIIAVWSIALTGILYTKLKARWPTWAQNRYFSTSLFLLMGWLLLVKVSAIIEHLSKFGLTMLLLGAVAYSVGAVIYALRKPNPFPGIFGFHELWHLMVLIGFISHYFLVLNFFQAFNF
jgi:hemolysin III